MKRKYIFYQGWTEKSRNMEKFLNENHVPYKIVHQDLDAEALILFPNLQELYGEKYFDGLKKVIRQSIRDRRNN